MSNQPQVPPPRKLGDDEIPGAGVFNQLVEFTRQLQPIPNPDFRVSFRPEGWSPRIRRGGVSIPSAEIYPLQVLPFLDDTTWKVRVRYGTLNGEVPEISSTALNVDVESGPALAITTSSDGFRRVYIKVTIDGTTFDITTGGLEILEAATLPSDTATEAHIPLTILKIADGKIVSQEPQVKTNLYYAYFGGTKHHYFQA